MAVARPFSYNTGSTISGTIQVGNLAIGVGNIPYSENVGGVQWWNGPDEEVGYVIAEQVPSGNQPNPISIPAFVGFYRSEFLTDESFINLTNTVFGQTFVTALQCKNYLNTNGYWTSWPGQLPSGMVLFLDSGDPTSYPGSGNIWYDLSGYGNDGTLQGATYSSSNGGVIQFDGTNDLVSFPSVDSIPLGNSNYTISVWFKSDNVNNTGGLVGWGDYGSIEQVNALRLFGTPTGFRHYWWGNDLDGFVSMTNGQWYNVLVTFDGTTRSCYLNNTLFVQDTPGSGHDVPFASNLTLGVTNNTEYLEGDIAQVVIYNRTVTLSEIQLIFDSGKFRFGYDNTTPTPTPTNTVTPTVTPTNTPTRTPTPTVTPTVTPSNTPYPPNTYFFYLPEGASPSAPTSNGNLMFTTNGGSEVGYNPNTTDEVIIYLTDKSGTNHPNYVDVVTYGGVLTMTQGSNTVILSGNTTDTGQWANYGLYISGNYLEVVQASPNPFVSGSPINLVLTVNYPPTPTPTPTVTQTPTNTPTNTPTPSASPIPITGYGYNLVVLPYNPPASGNTIFPTFATPGLNSGTTNPNTFATNAVYWNAIDNLGVDRSSYFNGMTGVSVTAYFTQNSNTAIYSGSSTAFVYDGSPGAQAFNYNPNTRAGQLVLIQSASTNFITGQTVYISYVVN